MKQFLQRRTSNQPTILTSLCPWELGRLVLSFSDSDCDCDQFGSLIQSHILLSVFSLEPRYQEFHPENKCVTNKYFRVFLNGSVLNRNVSAVFILVLRPLSCSVNEASESSEVLCKHGDEDWIL